MKTIGIKLADGTFYPVLQEGQPEEKTLVLTTAHNNQTRVMVDLYRSATGTMEDAEYVGTLQIDNLLEHPQGDSDISFSVSLDENNELSAKIADRETGATSDISIKLVNRTVEERLVTDPVESQYEISETSVKEPMIEEASFEDNVPEEEETAFEETAFGDDNPVEEEPIFEETTFENNVPAEEESAFEETAFGDDVPTEEQPAFEEMKSDDTALDDFSFDDFEESPELSPHEPIEPEDTELKENSFDNNTFVEDPLAASITSKESFDDMLSDNDTPDDTLTVNNDENVIDESFDLPDFNDISLGETKLDDDFSFDESDSFATSSDDSFGDFDIPDDSFDSITSTATDSSGLSFDGLFDEDDVDFDTAKESESEDVNKSTRGPVVICIICAIICIIAVLSLLFVIPSKYNILKKDAENVLRIEMVEPTPVPTQKSEQIPEPEPEPIPVAKEDEVIIIEKAEEVKPEPPKPPKQEPKVIVYKIKWGDTLWDIADTYYKNPWRYKKIARYNGIKNPDYIISGTTILIPEE